MHSLFHLDERGAIWQSIKQERSWFMGTSGYNQTMLAEHYQAMIHTNDFYEYLKLFKELYRKQNTQRGRGRKVNAMDSHFYQMVEHVLREELAAAFGESQVDANKQLIAAVSSGKFTTD